MIHSIFNDSLFRKYSEEIDIFSIMSSVSHAHTDSNGIEKLILNNYTGVFYILKVGYDLADMLFVIEFLLCDKEFIEIIFF